MATPPPSQPQDYGKFSQEIKGTQPKAGSVESAINMLSDTTRRLRVLEDRYSNLRRKTQITDQNMLGNSKRLTQEIRVINDEIKDAKKDIYDMKGKLGLFIKELETCARSEDVKVIEHYVNMWSPIQFVTQHEAKSIVRHILNEVTNETFNKPQEHDNIIKEVDEDRS